MKYADIINLDRPYSKRKKMSMADRAAQFSPFNALTGYDELISESSRYVDNKIELDEDQISILDFKLQKIKNRIKNKPLVEVCFFLKDKRKNGGLYINYEGNLKRIDEIEGKLIFIDNKKINLEDIFDINELLDNL